MSLSRNCENRNSLADLLIDKGEPAPASSEGKLITMSTSTDRVRELIGRSRLSQGEFAAEVGLDAAKMSKSLNGTRRFSSLDLARIAERCGVSVDWLLNGEETPVATAARAATGSSAEHALREGRELMELRRNANRLGYKQPWSGIAEHGAGGKAIDQGDRLAVAALARVSEAGLDVGGRDLAGVIEAAFGADVCLAPLGEGFDGLAVSSQDGKLILAAITPIAARQRFTLAHELGHLLAGDNQGVHTDSDIYGKESKSGNSEIRANAFAASFLMPEGRLRGEVRPGFNQADFARLSVELMVSPSALACRLSNLRLIDDMNRDQWKTMSAKGAASISGAIADLAAASAQSSEPRRPGLLKRDLFVAYLEGKSTLRPYAHLVGASTEQIRADLERGAESGA
ncbi:MAG: XRE family transcriptional regulator [Tetrasphaera sp.]